MSPPWPEQDSGQGLDEQGGQRRGQAATIITPLLTMTPPRLSPPGATRPSSPRAWSQEAGPPCQPPLTPLSPPQTQSCPGRHAPFPAPHTLGHNLLLQRPLFALNQGMFFKQEAETVFRAPRAPGGRAFGQGGPHQAPAGSFRDGAVGRGGVSHGDGRAPPPRAQAREAEAAEQMAKAQNNLQM